MFRKRKGGSMKIEIDNLYDELWDIMGANQKDINRSKLVEGSIGSYTFENDIDYGIAKGWIEAMQFVIHKIDNLKKK